MSNEFDHIHHPEKRSVIDQLLESIALEEIALANLLNTEAAKIQAFVGTNLDFPTNPSNQEILSMNQSFTNMLKTVVMSEWLLLNKLEETIHFAKKQESSLPSMFNEEMANIQDLASQGEEENKDEDVEENEEQEETVE